jgi:hypothetical protein
MRPTKYVGGNVVIVVFVCNPVLAAPPAGTYSIINDSATFLRSWHTPYQKAGVQPGVDCQAYSVSASAGEFMKATAPGGEDASGGIWFTVCAFAIDSELGQSASVDRAEAGVKKIIPAIYSITHTHSDLPTDMAPPGLLWLVETGGMYGHRTLNWKMRYDDHRTDDDTSPPNIMVQCYPVGHSYSGPFGDQSMTWSGYQIYAYRLDQEGTGHVYGKQLSANEDARHVIAPEWDAPITSPTFAKGIPLKDPPPFIRADK